MVHAARTMIDLHTHTTESDGTFTPAELIEEAARIGLEALAITDHDTFAGADAAIPYAAQTGLELICGIELSTKYCGTSVHVLGYFLKSAPAQEFRAWMADLQTSRCQRNADLIEKLREHGMPVTMEDLTRGGRKLIARPHFAAVMVEKGYVQSVDEAFEKYLDESSAYFVPRQEPAFVEAVERIRSGGGVPVVAHPGRIRVTRERLKQVLQDMRDAGLGGIEAYHSDHSREDVEFFESIAGRLGLPVSGGSDFHGSAKPRISLGSGIRGNVSVPYRILEELRARA